MVSRAAAAALAVVAVLTSCTQTDKGTPRPPARSPSTSSASPGPSGAAASPMCRDFRAAGDRLHDVQHAGRYGVELWRKLAADAPAAIKPDAELVAGFVAAVAAGHADAASVPRVMRALGRVTDWATRNCI